MKKIFLILIVATLFIPSMVFASDLEKVIFVQCDDSISAKFRSDDNELLTIKFLGIIVPEQIEKDAYIFLNDLLFKAEDIRLEYDSNSSDVDSFGRHYAWVFIDGELIQNILVEEGYANISSQIVDYKYMDTLKLSVDKAKDSHKGIWKVEKEEVVVEEKPVESKGLFKKILASIAAFIDKILDRILLFLENMI